MESGCSNAEVETIQRFIGYLPKPFLKEFKARNGRVILVSDIRGNYCGLTKITNNSIKIYIEDGYTSDCILHEFGHVFDNFYPIGDDFKEIYETEAKSLVNAYYGDCPYFYSNETEYFAHAFQTVIYARGYDIQDVAPKTFSYVMSLIEKRFGKMEIREKL